MNHTLSAYQKDLFKIILLTLAAFIVFAGSALAQSRVEIYPKVIRLDKGKTRTVTAVAFGSSGSYMPNQTFTWGRSTGNASTASIRRSPEGNTESSNSRFSANLGEISGLAPGTATFTASLNGVTSNEITVTVVDPAAQPSAIIKGDNEAEGGLIIRARVGEAIEVNADSSQGVKLAEWFWGDGDRTSDLLSATHAYLAAGSYELKLRVTNSGGQTSDARVTVVVTDHAPATQTFTVTTAAQLLAAYNQCTGGEHIVIPAGTVISGHIVLPARTFSDFVTIRSSATMPGMAVRVDPAQTDLAILRGDGINELPLLIQNRASKIRLSGIKFEPYPATPETAQNYYLLQIGQAFGQSTAADNPTKIILDHCVVNPPDNVQVVHAILNDGYKVSVIASWLGNIKTYGSQDSQAIFSLDGRGAHVYNNTYMAAASESVIYGGAGNQINGMVPTNIEFRRCVFTKPVAWRQLPSNGSGSLNAKNLFETKNARRVYIEGSLFSNHWDALRSQYYALVFKSASDYPNGGQGSPWSVSEEIVVENNRVSHVNGGVAVARDFYRDGIVYDALKPQHIRIVNSLFDDLTFGRWGDSRTWTFYMAGVDDLQVKHVSVIDANDTPDETHEAMMVLNSVTSYRPEIVDSILPLNYYGIRNTCGEGIAAMNVGTSGWFDPATGSSCGAASGANAGAWRMEGNVFPKLRSGHSTNSYPQNNAYATNYAALGMQGYRNCAGSPTSDPCDMSISAFTLRSDSLYKNAAGDNTDPGINGPHLTERVRCTSGGDTRTCLTAGGAPPTSPTSTPTAAPTPTSTATATATSTPTATPTATATQTSTPTATATATATPTSTPTNDPTPTASPTPSPIPGAAAVRLPAIVEAENFKLGGEGIGYHEIFGETGSGSYRDQPVESVDVQSRPTASGGFAVVEAAAGEWLAFSVQVPRLGAYELGVRYASEFSGGTFHVEIDGQNVTGPTTVASTGSWGTFITEYRRVVLPAGDHELRIVLDSNSTNPQTGAISPVVCNIDSIIVRSKAFDFTGAGRSNLGVFRPSDGSWYINTDNGENGPAPMAFGISGDIPVASDYDGDGKTDIAVFRPTGGAWHIVNSSDPLPVSRQFGAMGDIPVQADYDGDGRADIAVFRPTDGNWWIDQTTGGLKTVNFGLNGDVPVPGDYDADGRSDVAVFRPSTGSWYILRSRTGLATANFGIAGDVPAAADYDGDGRTDIAIFRPTDGAWWLLLSTGGTASIGFGMSNDVPVPADYDGDGRADIAVFRPSDGTWYIVDAEMQTSVIHYGSQEDKPLTRK